MSWTPPSRNIQNLLTPHSLRLSRVGVSVAVAGRVVQHANKNVGLYHKKINNMVRQIGYRKRKVGTVKVSKAVQKYVAKRLKSSKELKGRSYGLNVNLVNSLIYTANVTSNVSQGTFDFARDGDAITLRKLELNYNFIAPTTAGAYGYRMLVLYSGEEYSTVNLSSTLGLAFTEVFQPSVASLVDYLGIPNNKAVTVLADRSYSVNSQVSATSDIINDSMVVPLYDHKFLYQANAALFGKVKNLYIVCLSFVAGGTNVTSSGTVNVNYNLVYADS